MIITPTLFQLGQVLAGRSRVYVRQRGGHRVQHGRHGPTRQAEGSTHLSPTHAVSQVNIYFGVLTRTRLGYTKSRV